MWKVVGLAGSMLFAMAACTALGDGLEEPDFEGRSERDLVEPTPQKEDSASSSNNQEGQPVPLPTGTNSQPVPPLPPAAPAPASDIPPCTIGAELAEPNDAMSMALAPEGGCGTLTAMNDVDQWSITVATTRTRIELKTSVALSAAIDGPGVKLSAAGLNPGPFVFRATKSGVVTIRLSKGQGADARYRITVTR